MDSIPDKGAKNSPNGKKKLTATRDKILSATQNPRTECAIQRLWPIAGYHSAPRQAVYLSQYQPNQPIGPIPALVCGDKTRKGRSRVRPENSG